MKHKYRCTECVNEPCTLVLHYMDDRIDPPEPDPQTLSTCLCSRHGIAKFERVK